MDIPTAKFTELALSYSPARVSGSPTAPVAESGTRVDIAVKQDSAVKKDSASEKALEEKTPLSQEKLERITKEMSQFMKMLDTDIEFELHKGADRWMVKVVDSAEHKVLREFPPEKLLDTIAAIREYVGILLDEKV